MKQHYKIYENSQFFLVETKDYDGVYELLFNVNFPELPSSKKYALSVLNKAKILGFFDKKEGLLMGALLLFDGYFVDIAMNAEIHKRWATKHICVACMGWIFKNSSEVFIKMVLYKNTTKLLTFLGGEFDHSDCNNRKVFILYKAKINPSLLKIKTI
jgi:hypothetical protein